ncbi:hypothetical protein [Streptomyces sp. NPDC002346]
MPLIAAAATSPLPPIPAPLVVADGYGISIGGFALHQVDGRLAVRMPDGRDQFVTLDKAT